MRQSSRNSKDVRLWWWTGVSHVVTRMRTSECDVGKTLGLTGLAGVASAIAVHLATYGRWRERCLGWGATPEELRVALPGDDLLLEPDIVSTRVVTVDAPAECVWPWLVQMGPGRGGAYTYDWIENLFGLGMHSAAEILPQYQDLNVGDKFQLGTHGPTLHVAVFEPQRALVIRSDDGNWIWTFCLRPAASGTRLISRNRIATPDASPMIRAVNKYLMEPGSLIMERKMLAGIRHRAERLATSGHDASSTIPPQ